MTLMTPQNQIETLLRDYQDPYLQQDLLSAKAIKEIKIEGDKCLIEIQLPYPIRESSRPSMLETLQNTLSSLAIKTEIKLDWKVESYAISQNIKTLPEIKNIIAVASGKGGVGKSTTAVNLALALKMEGANVGLLDADIYGPNQPHMLGVRLQPEIRSKSGIQPVMNHGIQSISIGYLIDVNTPMIWRGPMVSQALQQLLNETQWQNLDYLIIDLPPGTGDIQLTMAQKIPVTGAVIVTTPQDIALLDARKGLEMFRKVNIPILGIIENMSGHVCSHCGHREDIFGNAGAARLAEETNSELLGHLPLDKSIREQADSGQPTVVSHPNSEIAGKYRAIALRLAAKLSLQGKNYAAKFPKIVVES